MKVDSYNTNTADLRIDEHFREQDQAFFHYDYISSVRLVSSTLRRSGRRRRLSDGTEIYNVRGFALGYTHTFSPTLVNEARLGYTRGHDTRTPSGESTMGIPEQFGIPGVPQLPLNGGLPYLGVGDLSGLGGAGWLPGNRFSDTEQMTENLTKVYKKHTFKAARSSSTSISRGWLRRLRREPFTSTAAILRFPCRLTGRQGERSF